MPVILTWEAKSGSLRLYLKIIINNNNNITIIRIIERKNKTKKLVHLKKIL